MKIIIVGSGSIGLLLAAYSSKVGHEVTVITHRQEQAETINKNGLKLKRKDGSREMYFPLAIPINEWTDGVADCVIIAVKSYQVADVIKKVPTNVLIHSFLFIQNGMGHLEVMENLHVETSALAVVEHGAMRESDAVIVHTGEGRINWSFYEEGNGRFVQELFKDYNDVQFTSVYQKDWLMMLSLKLLVNVAINPLSMLTLERNGQLLKNDSYHFLLREIVKEAAYVLGLDFEEGLEKVEDVCRATAENESSMLTDRKNARQTELEAILGYVVKESEKQQLHTPYLDFLYRLTKGIEQSWLKEVRS